MQVPSSIVAYGIHLANGPTRLPDRVRRDGSVVANDRRVLDLPLGDDGVGRRARAGVRCIAIAVAILTGADAHHQYESRHPCAHVPLRAEGVRYDSVSRTTSP